MRKPQCVPRSKESHEDIRIVQTIPAGTAVIRHYRRAIGHGTVTVVHKAGTTADNTMYSVKQNDHHPGGPAVVCHSGKALTRTAK